MIKYIRYSAFIKGLCRIDISDCTNANSYLCERISNAQTNFNKFPKQLTTAKIDAKQSIASNGNGIAFSS